MEVTANLPLQGEVIAKLNGFGFIQVGEEEFFFHKTALRESFFAMVRVGQRVEFIPDYENPKGYSAKDVYLIA